MIPTIYIVTVPNLSAGRQGSIVESLMQLSGFKGK
jgi:hypothetical protein